MSRNLGVARYVFLFAGLAVGCGAIPGPGLGGQPTPKATLSSTVVATTATAAPIPTQAPPTARVSRFEGTAVPAGRYFTETQGYRYTFSVTTSGWWTNLYGDVRVVGKVHGDNGPSTRLFILGGVVDLPTDACHWEGTNSIPGPTVDDLAAALAAVEGFESSEPSETTVDKYSGKYVRLTVPADVNTADCDNGEYHGIGGFFDISPGQVQDVWVLDLDGTRHVSFSAFDGNTPAAAQDEMTQLIDSLEIDPEA